MKRRLIKTKILLKQNYTLFISISIWYLINFIIIFILTGGNLLDTLSIVFYFQVLPGPYGIVYPELSELIIFGIILTFIITEFYRKYNPIQTALEQARSMREHTIIIGYSHLGKQIRNYLVINNKECLVIEPDEELVRELLDEECPVIIRKAYDIDVLKDASVQHAKLVFITRNDLDTLIVATSKIRDLNKRCKIVCRCFDDSVAEIIEKTFNCKTISTSRYASEFILKEIQAKNVENSIIIGYNNIAVRLIESFKTQGIKYKIIERERNRIEDIIDDEPVIVGDAKDEDNLKKAGIEDVDMVIALVDRADEVVVIADKVRDLNKNCGLICRFFHEDVGEILGKPPFNAIVISRSKHALDLLINEGVFNF
ncbi:MAG: NAD-binding protein [Candidatus Helarchaeota archaeon]|nr:NAD-binding protein [Candidatus Helarchaeota archaeon]